MTAISTSQYLKDVLPQQPFISTATNIIEKTERWICAHPTTVKIVEWLAITGGFLAIACLPLTFPAIGFGAIALAVVGGIIGSIAFLAYRRLDFLIPPSHAIAQHAFKETAHEGTRLYYAGDIPILEIKEGATPYQAGYAHGYLLGDKIEKIRERYQAAASDLSELPKAEDLPLVLSEIKKLLPPEYVEELNGLVEGFNAWAKTCWFKPKAATLEELLRLHLIPDSIHFNEMTAEEGLKPQPVVACTAILNKDKDGHVIFARNMDWQSLGLFGTYTLVTQRPGGIYSVGLPGLIGTVTGMKKSGLSLAMNVCSGQTQKINGMPAIFYNRHCLENCDTVDAVDDYVTKYLPLGAYHLTVADASKATSFHLHQGDTKETHFLKRELEKDPLIVTNCHYAKKDGVISSLHGKIDFHGSFAREEILTKFFADAQEKIATDKVDMLSLMEKSTALPYVNNLMTTHRIVMLPAQGVMKVSFDNAWAGDVDLQTINL